MPVSHAQFATELHQLTTARQDAEAEYRARLAELDALEQTALAALTAADLEDRDLRGAVSNLLPNPTARKLLRQWSQTVVGPEFDLSYGPVVVPVHGVSDDDGAERFESLTRMLPTLRTPLTGKRGPDGMRRPSPTAVEQLEGIVEKLCEGAGVVALNLDALGFDEQTIVRAADGTWEHRGPAPHGVLQHRGSFYDAMRWFHRTAVAVEDEDHGQLWRAPGETLSESLGEGALPFWREMEPRR